MKEHIFLSSAHMSDEGYEQQYIKEAFDTNWIAPLGKNVNSFEQEVCEKIGALKAVALSSGTSAIHLALILAGVSNGDKVFCQSLTFSATANPILYQNATPIFIDSEKDTWNMSPEALKLGFEKYPETKAVLVVDLYGIPAKLDEISQICKQNGAVLIEDSAESLGTCFKGKYTGCYGDFGIFSFNGNKIITTSGGGMLVSNADNAEQIIKKALFYATQSKENERHYEHKEVGYNYRMSNVVAGIGRGQLKVLDQRVSKKQYIYSYYKQAFSQICEIKMMPVEDISACNCWLSCITLENSKVKPLDIIIALEKENIEARLVWKPMHKQPVFEKYDYISNGDIAEEIFKNGLCLPSDTKITNEQLEEICNIIKRLF